MTSSLAASYLFCERLARQQARNFYHAFRVLPAPQRRSMCALYAFLRIADDVTDGPESTEMRQAALAHWRQLFERTLSGEYRHPLHEAFHHTLRTYAVPREYIDAVLDGVAMDLVHEPYATFEELYQYCYRVASAVGLACIHIWGFADSAAKSYAESAGIAFQLTNILRDLSEDAKRGRIYLPHEDLQRFGYSVEDLRQHIRNCPFRELMTFQVARARQYYNAARPLADLLDPAGRAVFQVLSQTYQGLLETIEKRDYDVFSSRVSLSRWRKLSLVLEALPARWGLR